MKRKSKAILFITIAAITFGSVNHFVGHRNCGKGFKNPGHYEQEMMQHQNNTAPAKALIKGI